MRILRRLLAYLKPYAVQMVIAAVLLAVGGALMAVVVSTVKPLVNDVLMPTISSAEPLSQTADTGPDILRRVERLLAADGVAGWARRHAFAGVPVLIVTLFLVRGVVLYFGQYLTIKAGGSVIRDLRVEIYEAVARQSLDFFAAHPTGTILSRILNDVARLQKVSTTVLADLIRVGAMVPFVLAVALVHEWRMSLLSITALPLLGYPMVRLGKRLRRASTASQEHMATVANLVAESVGGVKVVQGFGMEAYEVGRFRRAVERMLRADLRAGRVQALSPAVMELLGAVVGAALFYLAGLHIARGNLNAGDFAVVLFCLGLLFMSIRKLNTLYAESQNALAAAERVFRMIDRPRTVVDRPGATALAPFRHGIVFDNVSFSYGDARVLEGIDLKIARGELVALVGASGAGKSTTANLLPRFFDPTAGRVLIDGTDIRTVTLASLRDQIGLVTQETVLFDDTVRNNVAYGRENTPFQRVIEVAQASQAHAFIEALPAGYETMLGERGARLSMGQRQRLTIARALLKDPPILILDEATSALDAESESQVQQALERLMQGRTSIVIAHRLSTVRNADRIVVLDAGRIVEQGTHAELLARNGAYTRLYELQFKDVSA